MSKDLIVLAITFFYGFAAGVFLICTIGLGIIHFTKEDEESI